MYVILLFVVMNSALHISRRVGMADDADSKSVVGNHVWVQVPPPAVKKGVRQMSNVIKLTLQEGRP